MKLFYCSGLALAIIVCFAVTASPAMGADVEGVRVWRAPDHTRLVFDLTGPVEHQVFSLPAPDRLVIDISSSSMSASISNLDLGNTPISNVRSGRRGNDLRVVLDLTGKVKPRSFVLARHGDKQDRLVIDIYDSEPLRSTPVPEEPVNAVEKINEISSQKRDVVIAIDAGHGGEDPGAVGPRNVYEKDVVFKVSRELAKLVEQARGYKYVMVRTGDYYIPLDKRRNKAREVRADLFISIHADAFHNARARGASVFALSRRGATSETARFLASKENEADLIGGVGGVSLGDKDDILAGVLVDLSMTATMASSLKVGGSVLKNIAKVTRLHKRQVEQAGFLVLKSPDVPSILVETGFISNPEEARKLGNENHRRKLANAIFNGIESYFEESPPEGTYLSWVKSKGEGAKVEYVIAKGDTLSRIAARYKVSVREIVRENRLPDTRIRVGQTLTIPSVLARQ
ncbi:MAG: N-acetylmuramoyl-L-alanine amidase [Cellvibrionaceae bacterium]|nr:N-acetylmuramoyl-L-alanine amidase [Cellvibrionaceae bacterium]